MKISLNWLKEFVDIPDTITPEELGQLLTLKTAEIEHVEDQGASFENMVVGKITAIEPHPNADKLQLASTNIGTETLKIVCGAPNIKIGMYVPVALIGAKVRWHGEGDLITLEKARIRGVESSGMICAGEEIGLEPTPEGIVDLATIVPENILAEVIGSPLAKTLGLDDVIFTLDNKSITHRPDLWGHYGIAREVAAIIQKPLKPLQTPGISAPMLKPEAQGGALELKVTVKNPEICTRYMGVMVNNIKIEPSPAWLQQRLKVIGNRPINNIVDATNYIMAEMGQPLHAFDAEKVKKEIIIRTAEKGEKITTLDGIERTLNAEDLVIADQSEPIAIAGIMGGANSEISNKTTTIILESATFDAINIRKTSTRLDLRTEAVQRFEKSLDPHLAEKALQRIVEIILKICPSAQVASVVIDEKNFEEKIQKVTVNIPRICSKIGVKITNKDVANILERLEFIVKENDKDTLEVTIPSFRATRDIKIEEDIGEEIARFYGYENIIPQLPELPVKLPQEHQERKLKHQLRQLLSWGLGFDEVYNYSFYSRKDIQKTLLPEELHLTLENCLSEDQSHLRISLLPNMLKNVIQNQKNFPDYNFYEIGRTYQDLEEYFPLEEKKVSAILVRQKKYQQEVFLDAKGALEQVLNFLHLPKIISHKGEAYTPYAHPQKYLSYKLENNDAEIARCYEIHPLVLKNWDIKELKIAGFEINLSVICQILTTHRQVQIYKSIAKFPAITFDISVIIDKNLPIGQIQHNLNKTAPELIQKLELFDLYEGSQLPENKKSAAFQIKLQSNDRTLTDQDMKDIQQKMFKKLQEMGGEIRGL